MNDTPKTILSQGSKQKSQDPFIAADKAFKFGDIIAAQRNEALDTAETVRTR